MHASSWKVRTPAGDRIRGRGNFDQWWNFPRGVILGQPMSIRKSRSDFVVVVVVVVVI